MSENKEKSKPNLEELRKKLDAPIPRKVIAKRKAQGNVYLDYLEGWYVIARLNEVFGNLSWGYSITELNCVHQGPVTNARGETKFVASYLAQVSLNIYDTRGDESEWGLGRGTNYTDVGYGNGMDAYDQGKCHELAAKEAVTDALKRAAKNLGFSMGLALYDKTQEMVTDDEITKNVETENVARREAQTDTNSKVRLSAAAKKAADAGKISFKDLTAKIKQDFGKESKDLTPAETDKLIEYLEQLTTNKGEKK